MKIDLKELKEFISKQSDRTKIYFGSDSERIKVNDVWHVDYLLAVVVHIDGNKGGKIFGEVHRERDYDKTPNRPKLRLMNEVMKLADLYLACADVVGDKETEIHLDINPKEQFGSSCVISEAVGYIRGVCGMDPVIKPNAFIASTVADRLKELV